MPSEPERETIDSIIETIFLLPFFILLLPLIIIDEIRDRREMRKD